MSVSRRLFFLRLHLAGAPALVLLFAVAYLPVLWKAVPWYGISLLGVFCFFSIPIVASMLLGRLLNYWKPFVLAGLAGLPLFFLGLLFWFGAVMEGMANQCGLACDDDINRTGYLGLGFICASNILSTVLSYVLFRQRLFLARREMV